jgi:UDP-glucose 4-epimerase
MPDFGFSGKISHATLRTERPLMSSSMRILVTGGAGFIGSHIVAALCQKGHQVTVLDNLSSGNPTNLVPEATLVTGDITDQTLVQHLFQNNAFEAVFHLAAQIDVRASVSNPQKDAETNIMASLNLIQNAAANGVQRFIFSSTGGAIYGDTDARPTIESHSENPLSPYGIGKLAIDKYLAFYAAQYPMQTVSLRYANVYGPRQNPHGEAGVVAIFLNKMLAGENPHINGDGNQTRDYVFVEDVALANLAALETKHAAGVYNIGTGRETSVNELFTLLNNHFANAFIENHAPGKPGEQLTSALSSGRAAEELDWNPKITLEEGLQKTLAWFRDQHAA